MSKDKNPERNAEIARLRGEGMGPREIARRLGLSPSLVAGVLHRWGLCTAPLGRGNGATEPFKAMAVGAIAELGWVEAARIHGVSVSALGLWRKELAA